MLMLIIFLTALPMSLLFFLFCLFRSNNQDQITPQNTFNKEFKAQITKIIDGDTLRIEYKNESYKIRLYGIDAPEMAFFGKKAQEGAEMSRDYLVGMCLEKDVEKKESKMGLNEDLKKSKSMAGANTEIKKGMKKESKNISKNIKKDIKKKKLIFKHCHIISFAIDHYNRPISQIKINNKKTDLSIEMVKNGYADVYEGVNHVKFNYEKIVKLKDVAKREGRGVWAVMKERPREFKKKMRGIEISNR